MGVRTNAGGGASVAKLKTALQYADTALGIDVDTSSYAEICDALAAYFPEALILFDGSSYASLWTKNSYAYVDDTIRLVRQSVSGRDGVVYTTSPIDVTTYNTLEIDATVYGSTRQTYSYDVSALTGNYTVRAYGPTSNFVKFGLYDSDWVSNCHYSGNPPVPDNTTQVTIHSVKFVV